MKTIELKTPILEEVIRKLRVGDTIYYTGTLFTARDAAHKRILQHLQNGKKLPFSINGAPLYHCGPLVRQTSTGWTVIAAGPTTSMRMEAYEEDMIKNLGVRLIIGKGGMGEKTVRIMKEFGAVYGTFTGGAAVLASKYVKKVRDVQWLDLGVPEAIWVLEVEKFGPLIICIDSYGNNLYAKVQAEAENNKAKILENPSL
ncbi:fumarate hydratase C-terminal domain-containing protein [Candidatus Bathyarchaeota archaeon]|nr:fumarate hydratase C-terminal domain-containing protein [Candidatus Bathyarchaeota archaeon]